MLGMFDYYQKILDKLNVKLTEQKIPLVKWSLPLVISESLLKNRIFLLHNQ